MAEGVGYGLFGHVCGAWIAGNSDSDEHLLHHQVDAECVLMDFADRPAAHPRIHLDEPRPSRRVLALNVEDAVLEADSFDGVFGHFAQVLNLFTRQQRRQTAPRFGEIGFVSRPVVRHGDVSRLPVAHDDVDVHLVAIQVLLQHHRRVNRFVKIDAVGPLVGSGTRAPQNLAPRNHQPAHYRYDFAVHRQKLCLVVHLLHAQRTGAAHRLQHRRKADLSCSLLELRFVLDEHVGDGGQPGVRQDFPGEVFVARDVHRLGLVAGEPSCLGQTRHHRHTQLPERADAVRWTRRFVRAELLDGGECAVEHRLSVHPHVHGDELRDNLLLDKRLRPRVRCVDDDCLDAHFGGFAVDELLLGIAGRKEDDGGSAQQLAPQLLLLGACVREHFAGDPAQHLEGRGGLGGSEGRQAGGQFSEHRMLQDLLIRINAVHTFLSFLEVYLYLMIRYYLEGYYVQRR